MIPLFDTRPDQLQKCADELNCKEFGQLLTPRQGYRLDATVRFAIDNGCYSGFSEKKFLHIIERSKPDAERCLFVTVPDVVGSARRTLEIFRVWVRRLSTWPRAFVAQDGVENLEVPWDYFDCLFVGGTNKFKNSPEAEHVVRAAKIMGKWVHVGRVNEPLRWERFKAMGADSCDGTGLARFDYTRKPIAARRLFEDQLPGEVEE